MHFRITRPNNSISLKIILAFVIGILLSVAIITLIAMATFFSKSTLLSEADIAYFTDFLADEVVFDQAGNPITLSVDEEHMGWLFESLDEEVAYRILDSSANAVLYSAAGEAFWQNIPADAWQNRFFSFEINNIIVDGATSEIEYNGQVWLVQSAISQRFMNFSYKIFALRFMQEGILWFALVLVLVFGICAQITLSLTLRPLHKLSESAAAISPHSINARLSQNGVPSEIAPLVQSFNQTLDRLEIGYRVQQEFLASAAHELKTPLTLIQAQLELMTESQERSWLLRDVEYMSRQVQQLLLLAEASEVRNYTLTAVDLVELVTDVTGYLSRIADTARVTFHLDASDSPVIWQADKGALFTLLKNLLENAVQHAPTNSAVDIYITQTTCCVRDHGPGLDQEHIVRLFERFWRASDRRDTGAGLGLAICREIAQAHGWVLTARQADPGLYFELANVPADPAL